MYALSLPLQTLDHPRLRLSNSSSPTNWVLITGGCSGRGVQWIGVVLYNQLVYNII